MEVVLAWIDRFRLPLTVVLVTAIVAGTGLLAFRSLQLRSLVAQAANSVTSNDEIASLKKNQQQLEKQLSDLQNQSGEVLSTIDVISNQSTTVANMTSESASGAVHLNSADLKALDTLTGIGPSKAQLILDYRNSHGSFKSIDELLNVKGIGDATLAKIRPQLTLD